MIFCWIQIPWKHKAIAEIKRVSNRYTQEELREYFYEALSIKHRARQEKWMMAIGECRSSGLSVREWYRQQGVDTNYVLPVGA